ncbi:hypothetical protein BKA65DRAFT_510774 [Rhexocercosporidium sp. MPI-PUGE-AT-0058]|nr:hypothetical protein BKA65DRAFT_510774 [Rhexocercosporidium sp. MPI-PUGE-AT-0058]
MRISLPNAVNGLGCLLSLISSTTAACNANNCLRALQNPTFTSSATVFCKAYTKSNNPYPTAIPKELKNCNGEAAAISSACSCFLPVATITSRTSSTLTTKFSSGKSSNVCPCVPRRTLSRDESTGLESQNFPWQVYEVVVHMSLSLTICPLGDHLAIRNRL